MSSKKQLVYSILEFLNQCQVDGTIKAEDKESLEVATQCIGEVFGVDLNDETQNSQLSIKPTTLLQIFEVFLKTQKKTSQTTTEIPSLSPEEIKKKAEELKNQGNVKLTEKKFAESVELYTQAIQLDPKNAVYYSNRAAAYSQMNEQDKAIEDALKSAEINPNYSKAYSRLGHAYYSKGSYNEAVEAYTKALELDPNNANMKSALENSKQRIQSTRSVSETSPTDNSSSNPDPFANLGNMFGGGNNPLGNMNLQDMLQNPAIMSMAQQFMQSGAYDQLMKDPSKMMEMAQGFMGNNNGSSNGDNPLANLMKDPNVAKLAEQFKNNGFGQPPKKD